MVSGSPGAFENGRNGARKDFEVQEERPLADVLQIQFHPLFERHGASAADLPQAGDAGADAETAALPVFTILGEQIVIAHLQRPGTEQAHMGLEYIEELWQFVNTGPAQELADGREPWIVLDFEHRPRDLIEVLNFAKLFLRFDNHRSEFVNPEHALVVTHAFLHEKHWPWRCQLD